MGSLIPQKSVGICKVIWLSENMIGCKFGLNLKYQIGL